MKLNDPAAWGKAVIKGKQRVLELGEDLERKHEQLLTEMHTYKWIKRATWWNEHMLSLAVEGRATLLTHQWNRLRRWYRLQNQRGRRLQQQKRKLGLELGTARTALDIQRLAVEYQAKAKEMSRQKSLLGVIYTYINPEHERSIKRQGTAADSIRGAGDNGTGHRDRGGKGRPDSGDPAPEDGSE